jgi:hypothetical protein
VRTFEEWLDDNESNLDHMGNMDLLQKCWNEAFSEGYLEGRMDGANYGY